MSNSYYDSNRPYNPQQSNRPVYNVIPAEYAMKRPGAAEGAAWGAGQAMIGASLYSGLNEVARKTDASKTMKVNPKLGALHYGYQKTAAAADKVIDGQEKFSSIMSAANESPNGRIKGMIDEMRGENSGSKENVNRRSSPTAGMSAKEKMQHHAKTTAPDQMGRMAARTLFGTGWKNNVRRIGIAAIPGAITGALHNASNGIVGPY